MSKYAVNNNRISDSTPKRFLVGLLAYGSTTLLMLFCLGMAYVHFSGAKPLSVQSGSMAPTLQKGDLVIANPVSESQLQSGDVVTFINPANKQQTITHRVLWVDRTNHTMQTKGDANAAADEPLNTTLIVGKVDQAIPYVGMVIDAIRQPIGLALIIYLPALMVVIAEMRRLARHYQSQKIYLAPGRKIGGFKAPRSHSLLAVKVSVGFVVGGVFVGLVIPVYASLSSSAQLVGNTITSVPIPASYQVCSFPATSTLLSYALIDVLYPEQPDPPIVLDEPIIPGTYKITAISNDTHVIHPNAPSQPNERWLVHLYGDDPAEPLHATGVTEDIPDDIDQTITVINEAATFNDTVTGIRYVHNAFLTGLEKEQFGNRKYDELSESEKRQVLWNSVHPGCITFERIQNTPQREQ